MHKAIFISSVASCVHSVPVVLVQDKNPSPLNQLDFLMDETYSSIMDTGSIVDVAQEELEAAANKLACTVNLIVNLIRYWTGWRGLCFDLGCHLRILMGFKPYVCCDLSSGTALIVQMTNTLS